MTANQVNYWTLQEQKRSNLVREAETERANKAKEAENYRTNSANEALKSETNAINKGHYAITDEIAKKKLASEVFKNYSNGLFGKGGVISVGGLL